MADKATEKDFGESVSHEKINSSPLFVMNTAPRTKNELHFSLQKVCASSKKNDVAGYHLHTECFDEENIHVCMNEKTAQWPSLGYQSWVDIEDIPTCLSLYFGPKI